MIEEDKKRQMEGQKGSLMGLFGGVKDAPAADEGAEAPKA